MNRLERRDGLQLHNHPLTNDEIQAMYRFHCEGATSTRMGGTLGVKLFDNLPGLEKLKLQLATDKGESAAELTPAANDIAL